MGFFSFMNTKSKNDGAAITLPVAEEVKPVEVNGANVQATSDQQVQSPASKPLTVSYATGWPIDVIYGYLHKKYEEKGFDDAMVKSDLAFRDMNMNIIKNKILMVFREINLNYDVMKHDYETRMETCRAAGLLSTVSEIEKTMTIINTHKEELRKLESDFRNNANEASIPLQSYECGFLRGIATIALGSAQKSISMPQNLSMAQKSYAIA